MKDIGRNSVPGNSPPTPYLKRIKSRVIPAKGSNNSCWINYLHLASCSQGHRSYATQRLRTPACTSSQGPNQAAAVKLDPKPSLPLTWWEARSPAQLGAEAPSQSPPTHLARPAIAKGRKRALELNGVRMRHLEVTNKYTHQGCTLKRMLLIQVTQCS